MKVRTRFAPSPTGYLHIGSLRTALYCYLWAKNQNGKYILRIEDTDRTRYVPGSVENLIAALNTCNVAADEGPALQNGQIIQTGEYGPYYQSERLELYQKYAKQLIGEKKAYYCFCSKQRLDTLRQKQAEAGETPKYDGHCSNLTPQEIEKNLKANIPYVIRIKLPRGKDVTFDDIVYGPISINTNDIDEQVLIKSDGFPTYHFAVVIDDRFMEITHVIRGEEWLVSTPKHLLLYEAFGWKPPQFAHLPTVLNPNRKKLSKRDGSATVDDFLKEGYSPQALVNYIAQLGWSMPDGREIFSLREACDAFDLKRINKSGAIFDKEKLNWLNAQYIKQMDDAALCEAIRPYIEEYAADERRLVYIAMCVKDRISVFSEARREAKSILKEPVFSQSEEAKEARALDTNARLYEVSVELLNELESLDPENIQQMLKIIQKEYAIKGKNLYMGLRIAITGEIHGPDIGLIMCILGKDEVIKRLSR